MKLSSKHICWFFLLFFSFVQLHAQAVIETRYFRYEISATGENRCFVDKNSETDYLYSDTVSTCAYIIMKNKQHNANFVTLNNNRLTIRFGESGVSIDVAVQLTNDAIRLRIESVTGFPESITFLNVPLTLKGAPYESFAACVLSMNLQTQVEQLPPLQTHLQASAYARFGIKGSEINLLGVPQKEILPVIRSIMKQAKDIPFSDKGGAWAVLGKEGYGSYLMQGGELTEETVDEWIETCRTLGFNQIDNHGGGSFFSFGELELNRNKWPDGWASFKRINQKLHKAGISSILHTYSFYIDKNTRYVTPVPSKELGYFRTFTLLRPMTEKNTEIVVNESTASISTITGFMEDNSISLRIGNEIIEFTGVTQHPPYKFTGCRRGVHGTKASAHGVTDTLFHLREKYGRFVPDPNSKLFDEIAKKTADVVNYCEFDGIYFDAIDGCHMLAGKKDAWYYGTKFLLETAKHLKRPVGMEMSMMFHHWWHYRSRFEAWDYAIRNYKQYVDIHLASIKGNGQDMFNPSITRQYAFVDKGRLQIPSHLGWWNMETWNPPQYEPTFPDDIEYLCCKMLGNNAGLSVHCWDRKNTINKPAFKRLSAIIRQYEELRHNHYFNDSVRTLLRQPGKEFTLFKENKNQWNFKPVNYVKHKVTGATDGSADWMVTNDFASQPLRLRLELLMSVKPYDDPENIVLTDLSDSDEFTEKEFAKGVTAVLSPLKIEKPFNEDAANFVAYSLGVTPQNEAWIKFGKSFIPQLNLENHQALGVWIKGDGNGELINLRTESPEHISFGARGDHFIKVDFTGWKYFELVELESSQYFHYNWGEKQTDIYNSFRNTLDFKAINKCKLWYNNLPAGKEVSCLISPVKALPMVSNTIENPTITIGGETIVFPVRMESGMYLELTFDNKCILYKSNGETVKKIRLKGKIPIVNKGENHLRFSCNETENLNTRVQVTVINQGEPLVRRIETKL